MTRRVVAPGQVYGSLEVLERVGTAKHGSPLWRCRCHRCGGECIVEGRRLTSGNGSDPWRRTDCGCAAAEKRIEAGKVYGGVEVLRCSDRKAGKKRLWIVRCRICGKEREMLQSSISRCPKSCGCIQHNESVVQTAAAASVDVNVRDGVQVYVATKATPNKGNTTGYRWVRCLHRRGGDWFFAAFQLQGERYYRGGFLNAQSAHEWAEAEHAKALERLGITDPRQKKRRVIQMNSTQFSLACAEAANYSGEDAFVSDLLTSAAFAPADPEAELELTHADALRRIWMAVAAPFRSLLQELGLGQSELARRYQIPLRTVQDWTAEKRVPPAYVRLMIARLEGYVQAPED